MKSILGRMLPMLVLLVLTVLTGVSVLAGVTPNALFSDNMVLQQGFDAPVWGKANPGERVTVSIAQQKVNVVTGADGHWMVRLKRLNAGGPYVMTIAGENSITINNVLVGEVWLASGQSNMTFGLGGVVNAKEEIASANYPEIRIFTVEDVVAGTPREDVHGQWQICTPETAAGFTAVGYLFARNLYQKLKVPIGIIHSAVGGTWAESWTSTEDMNSEQDFQPIFQRYADAEAAYPQALRDYQAKLATWNDAVKQATADNKPLPAKPSPPEDPAKITSRPGGLYNGKIAPLIPYRIRGVIWWQGEYNSPRSMQYKKLFPALINGWRKHWGQGDFPFYFVQLQNLIIPPDDIAHYEEMREAQLYTWQTVPNTGMAMMVDAGDAHDIHPPHKQVAAERLALIARAQVYGEKIVYSGPIYRAMQVEGDKVRLIFIHLGGGLVVKNGDKLDGFVIAGADKQFVPAEAIIDGATVVVSSPAVKNPAAVRYAWAANPTCTLYNKAGLPASPFRTDDWVVLTTGKN